MDNINDTLIRRAYHEAGCALALYRICFNLAKADETISSTNHVPSLLKLCRDFSGLSLHGERTKHWNNVAYFWRASNLIFLGGYAAVRMKLQSTELPSLSDPDFETAYYAQQWLYVDLDRNPTDEHVLRETLEGLTNAIKQLENQWKVVEILATTLLEKSEIPAEETFQLITANINAGQLVAERKAQLSRPLGKGNVIVTAPVAPKPRVDINYETIQDRDLVSSYFLRCCDGNADTFPFKCSVCGHIMVFCYECDTLYPNLENTSIMQLHIGRFSCPECHHEFEDDFMKNPIYYVTPAEWKEAGYESLLTEVAKKKLPRSGLTF